MTWWRQFVASQPAIEEARRTRYAQVAEPACGIVPERHLKLHAPDQGVVVDVCQAAVTSLRAFGQLGYLDAALLLGLFLLIFGL